MPAVNPQHQFLSYSKKEIGSYAADLAKLSSLEIPLPQTYCLPISTLQLTAKKNHLQEKFQSIIDGINANDNQELDKAVEQVQKLIKNQAFPEQVSQKLIELYQTRFNSDYIRLTASPVDGRPVDYKREDNIQGEANMMESILKLWAENIDPSDIKREKLFPIAVVIQAQFQPTVSGLGYSLDINTADKSKITIQAVYGVFASNRSLKACDQYYIDKRSWQISANDLAIKKEALLRSPDRLKSKPLSSSLRKKPALSEEQLARLATLINRIKLQYTHQILIHWELVDGDFLITKIKPYFFEPEQSRSHTHHKTLLAGQSLTTGFVQTTCQLIKKSKDIKNIKPASIAVVKKLTKDHRKLIHLCAGLISEEGVADHSLLNRIRHYQIPTIIHTKGAFNALKNDQTVILDASAGKVYSPSKRKKEQKKQSKLDLMLAINAQSDLDEKTAILTNGVGIIRSEHFFIRENKHPKRIIDGEKETFQESIQASLTSLYHQFYHLTKTIPTITYRSLNLDSAQLAKLGSGDVFESEEKNPFMGYRGAIRTINQPDLFELELDILFKANSKLDKPINLMLPFVRTPFELKQMWELLEQKSNSLVHQPPLWLQLNTPENILNIEKYLATPLGAICVNIKTINALMYAVDPGNSDLYHQYPINFELLEPLLDELLQKVKDYDQEIKIYLILSEFNQQLINYAAHKKLTGIIAQPKLIAQCNDYLLD